MSAPDCDAQWLSRIRGDHPRLFFNADTWPEVAQRATGVMADQLDRTREHADGPPYPPTANVEPIGPLPGTAVEIADWGHQLMSSALVYRLDPSPSRLADIKTKLRASAEYYHACYERNQEVNWYGSSRASCFAVIDWLWDEFTPEERREIGLRLLDHTEEALDRPGILRRNSGDHTSGFYGAPSIAWFAGLALHGGGVDDDRALDYLTRGYEANMRLLAHRAETSGEDGGSASPTLGYAFGEYPFAEWNFLHTWLSATGEDISLNWPYISLFPSYVFWNWLPGGLEFGYGDTPHVDNRLHLGSMYTHMSHIMHLYGEADPDRAALARYVRDLAGGDFTTRKWSVYPFLLSRLEQAPRASRPDRLPPARFFRRMGQLFMRSGSGDDDTYALFACDGSLRSHRHYDATHFTIYRSGHLALDTGTRQGNTDNLQNYFAQTVAHNCILIKMPGEPPS
ncbi:MAG: heparinase II/III family protein, partial [Candidatus Latescibacteria bacterium]|nr:heparinase II/III family protein [Candidatus Latescibacterota bacterium]